MSPLLRTQTPAGTTSMIAVARYVRVCVGGCVRVGVGVCVLVPIALLPLPLRVCVCACAGPYYTASPPSTGNLRGSCAGGVSIFTLL